MNRNRSWSGLVPILLGLAYGVSPVDLILDVIPLIGFVDDAIVVPLLLTMGFLQLRKSRRTPATAPIIHPPRNR